MDSHDKADNVSILLWNLKPDLLSCHLYFPLRSFPVAVFMFPFFSIAVTTYIPTYAVIDIRQGRRIH